jgi:nitrate/nitrite transporter NarK
MTSRSLWLNSLGQFCINVGWAFLITWLPTYLKDVQQVPDRTGSIMVTVVLSMGMLGQLVGGWATDASVRMIGIRFGRILPITIATWLAGLSYLGCIAFDSAIAVVICCAMVSFLNDVGNPSIWAFMQDVGGRSTATVFGWANMWGNMGAAAISVMVPYLMSYGESTSYGQSFVFIACALAFFIAGLAALGMNPTRKIVIRG